MESKILDTTSCWACSLIDKVMFFLPNHTWFHKESSPEYEVEEVWDGSEWRVVRKTLAHKSQAPGEEGDKMPVVGVVFDLPVAILRVFSTQVFSHCNTMI